MLRSDIIDHIYEFLLETKVHTCQIVQSSLVVTVLIRRLIMISHRLGRLVNPSQVWSLA